MRPHHAHHSLTTRERECLRMVSDGFTAKQISEGLGISVRTVESHLANAMHKLDSATRAQAIATAIRAGWLD